MALIILNDVEIAEKLTSDLLSDLLKKKEDSIVLYNDDINTFEHVIFCLIKYCEHSPEQAEQCAMLIHNKGKYAVKSGRVSKLLPIYIALISNKLSVKIE